MEQINTENAEKPIEEIPDKPPVPEDKQKKSTDKLSDDEILLTEQQLHQILDYEYAIRGTSRSRKIQVNIYKTQLPSKFLKENNSLIYCISLVKWIAKKEQLNLNKNPYYKGILEGKNPEYWAKIAGSEFYDWRDISRKLGINRTDAKTWIKKHPSHIEHKGTRAANPIFLISKIVYDAEYNINEVKAKTALIEQNAKDLVTTHQETMKLISEIDDKKVTMIIDNVDKYTIDIKKCQDDCEKGQSNDCEFYAIKDTGKLRSGCIYVRAHIRNITNELSNYINKESDGFSNFIKKQQFRVVINLEARHKYMSLQQPYINTFRTIYDKNSNAIKVLCETEIELIKSDALLQKAWKDLGTNPPKTKQEDFSDFLKDQASG